MTYQTHIDVQYGAHVSRRGRYLLFVLYITRKQYFYLEQIQMLHTIQLRTRSIPIVRADYGIHRCPPLRDDELTLIEKEGGKSIVSTRRRSVSVDRIWFTQSPSGGPYEAAVLKAFSHYQYNVGHRVVYMYEI